MTEWRPIAGYPGYDVSSDGEVRSWLKRGPAKHLREEPIIIVGGIDEDGYHHVGLRNRDVDSKKHTLKVHSLVLEAFVGPCPEGLQCCHGDGAPAHNWLSNLRWDTGSSNCQDKTAHGTQVIGVKHHKAKLNDHAVGIIRRSDLRASRLARVFGVTHTNIQSI